MLASEEFVKEKGLQDRAVEILGMEMTSDLPSTFEASAIDLVGFQMSRLAADHLYARTGLSPADFQVCELHDCFSANELITYDALRLCAPGAAGAFAETARLGAGGRVVVNTSGGLISKGHPLGATGIY